MTDEIEAPVDVTVTLQYVLTAGREHPQDDPLAEWTDEATGAMPDDLSSVAPRVAEVLDDHPHLTPQDLSITVRVADVDASVIGNGGADDDA